MIIIDTIHFFNRWCAPLPPPITGVEIPSDKPWQWPKWYLDGLEAGENPFVLEARLVQEMVAELRDKSVKSTKPWETSELPPGRPPLLRWEALVQLFAEESKLAKANGRKLKLKDFAKRYRLNIRSFRRARRLHKQKSDQSS